jgi:hypothetical protein
MTSPNAAASPVVPSSQPMAARARQGLRAARVAEHRGVAVAHGEFRHRPSDKARANNADFHADVL